MSNVVDTKNADIAAENSRRVMWLGMFLFLLGMLTAFVEPHVTNVRMGLAAHLVGLLNGIFLIALGAIWNEVRLQPRAKTIAFWTAMYGTYVNWLFTVLAAIFGTGAVSPVVLILWGLRAKALNPSTSSRVASVRPSPSAG